MKTLSRFNQFIICLVLFFSVGAFLYSENFEMAHALLKAKRGDFLVTAYHKNFTLFHIFDTKGNVIEIEEISAPLSLKNEIGNQWKEWVAKKAPGHVSWVVYELDLTTGLIQQMYSFSQQSWQKVYPEEQLFPILLHLKFNPIDEKMRKKAGPKPPLNIPDERSLWNPPIIFNGERVKKSQCDAYEAKWPMDQSELSGKKIEIYLPKESENLPRYFPFWIQASNQFAQAKMRVIDSGQHLQSPHKELPLPPLELVSQQYNSQGDLQFNLKAHPSFEEYRVYVRSGHDAKCDPIPFTLVQNKVTRQAKITITNDDLNNKLKSDRLYYFIFEPIKHPHLSVETNKPVGIAKPYVHQ